MDKKSKIFFLVFFLLILGSVGYTYYKIVIKKDYLITMELECDPSAESCYIYECTPEEDPECPENEEERASYYKLLTKKAYNFPSCDPNDENCPEPTCEEGEEDCEIANCDPSALAEAEECTKIEDFPIEEEGAEEEMLEDEAAAEETGVAEETEALDGSTEQEAKEEASHPVAEPAANTSADAATQDPAAPAVSPSTNQNQEAEANATPN